eukprot:CAMPEP_0197619686 /NCGR_PEP_ID=MMETSP1338-20131121/682_1 /TAXON_ID=43686 ORGANISM="Pelagodinium beii, Strain RCC1491" /NCGR_SAMPLE_ID=MMETSP1338 /ASSEMBLY_ACC=CAM_ASM_000754 /LENGTH=42 /DNA_ID= /DNA_START= /DNA_END= /DNA_ORIENTATION=
MVRAVRSAAGTKVAPENAVVTVASLLPDKAANEGCAPRSSTC